jgi:hypothetical protein
MSGFFVGALAYAHDLTLLAPHTCRSLQRLLTLCEEYASEFDIIFNGAESQCLFITTSNYNVHAFGSNPIFTVINGQVIEYVN